MEAIEDLDSELIDFERFRKQFCLAAHNINRNLNPNLKAVKIIAV